MLHLLDDVRPNTANGLRAMLADRLSLRQAGRWAAQFTGRVDAPARPIPMLRHGCACAAVGGGERRDTAGSRRSNLAEVRELGYLNERGLIGDVEFEAHRRRLLET